MQQNISTDGVWYGMVLILVHVGLRGNLLGTQRVQHGHKGRRSTEWRKRYDGV